MTLLKTFKRGLAAAVAFTLPVQPVFAQAAAAPAPTAAPAPAPARQLKPALWKISDADTTIYLFGTIHALPKGLSWLDGPVGEALSSSGELVTEIPDAPQAEQQQVVAKLGLLQGETLRSMLGDDERAAYEALLGKLKIPAAAFDQMQPWLAGVALGSMPYLLAGYGKDDGAEAVLRKAAVAKGLKQGALETVEFQLGLFASLPRDVQIRFLNQAVKDFDKAVPIITTMTSEWGEGDSEGLAKLLNESMDDPELAEPLLFQRNRIWASWIRKRLEQPGTVFIAVGAGHLAGQKSVQDMLVRQGVTAVRIQ